MQLKYCLLILTKITKYNVDNDKNKCEVSKIYRQNFLFTQIMTSNLVRANKFQQMIISLIGCFLPQGRQVIMFSVFLSYLEFFV